MTTITIPMPSQSAAFEAGVYIALLDMNQIASEAESMDAIRAILAGALNSVNNKLITSLSDAAVAAGFKAGEYEIGMTRENDGDPQIILTPMTAPVIGSEVQNPDAKLILPETPEHLVQADGESPLV